MSQTVFGDKFDDLNLSEEEIDRLTKCMKDEKFRSLFQEYAEEISDPKNRHRYEKEIAMLEKERGVDVKFINPVPGHVIKTVDEFKVKCFINICTNEALGKPKSQPSVQGSTKGMQWAIPHSVSQARQDKDRAGNVCMVFDVVFHPDTYYMLTKNNRFKQMIHDTAIDAVEKRFEVKLDRENLRLPCMKFKGTPTSSVIRTPIDPKATMDSSTLSEWAYKTKLSNGDNQQEASSGAPAAAASAPSSAPNNDGDAQLRKELGIKFITPEFTVKERGYFDIQDVSMLPGAQSISNHRPKELVIIVHLPKITAANSVNLEIFERRLKLKSAEPVNYKLDIKLPYPVDDNKGFAKFDKNQRKLLITLEVVAPVPLPAIIPMLKDDRLVEQIEKEEGNEDKIAKNKKAKFHERSRVHYQEGKNYSSDYDDEDEGKDGQTTDKKLLESSNEPLMWLSDTLIEMIYKYDDGLLRKCPRYIYFQDDMFVTIIIDIRLIMSVYHDSIWYVVYNDQIQFVCLSESLEEDQDAIVSIWCMFDDDLRVDPSRSRVDVSASNVVFLLRKTERGKKWNKMSAGLDPQNLQTRFFATNRNICDLFTMMHQQGKDNCAQPFQICKANKNDKGFLLLDLEPKQANGKSSVKAGTNSAATPKENGGQQQNKQPAAAKKMPNKTTESKSNNNNNKTETKPAPAVTKANNKTTAPSAGNAEKKKNTAATSVVVANDNDDKLCKDFKEKLAVKTNNKKDDVKMDSDDDVDDVMKERPPPVMTEKRGNGAPDEVIRNHKSTSQVKLSSTKMAFQLDDN